MIVCCFERSFIASGRPISFIVAYLGMTGNAGSLMTAAVYLMFRFEDINATDACEAN